MCINPSITRCAATICNISCTLYLWSQPLPHTTTRTLYLGRLHDSPPQLSTKALSSLQRRSQHPPHYLNVRQRNRQPRNCSGTRQPRNSAAHLVPVTVQLDRPDLNLNCATRTRVDWLRNCDIPPRAETRIRTARDIKCKTTTITTTKKEKTAESRGRRRRTRRRSLSIDTRK